MRQGRERGCWVYIPAPMLKRAGIALDELPPEYRVWAGPRSGVVVSLYRRTEPGSE